VGREHPLVAVRPADVPQLHVSVLKGGGEGEVVPDAKLDITHALRLTCAGTEVEIRWDRAAAKLTIPPAQREGDAGSDAATFLVLCRPSPLLSGTKKAPKHLSAPSLPAPDMAFQANPPPGHRERAKPQPLPLTRVRGRATAHVRTREGADRVLLAQVEAFHVAILGAAEEHVDLGGVEADLIDSALVLGEELVLLVAGRLAQVPGDHHTVGGSSGQQVLIHLVPHHVRAAEVQGGFAANAEVQLLHKLVLLDGVDLEDVAAGHHHLGGITAHADGIGRGVQVAEHGPSREGVAPQGSGDPGHLLHDRPRGALPSPGAGSEACVPAGCIHACVAALLHLSQSWEGTGSVPAAPGRPRWLRPQRFVATSMGRRGERLQPSCCLQGERYSPTPGFSSC